MRILPYQLPDAQTGQYLTHPTQAATSPARPESAKTASSPRDVPFLKQGRSERPKTVLPSMLVYVAPMMARMSPPLCASREARPYSLYLSLGEWPRMPFTARIERAQFHRAHSASKKGTWPLPALLANFFSILLKEPLRTKEIRPRRPRVRNP